MSIKKRLKESGRVLTLAVCMAAMSPMYAQDVMVMKDIVKTMPDSMMPYLTHNNRLDMIDFLESKMPAKVKNSFEGTSEMEALNDSYVRIKLNQAAILEMRLLKTDSSLPDSTHYIICIAMTVGIDSQQSSIAFYSAKWNSLNASDYLPEEYVVNDCSNKRFYIFRLSETDDNVDIYPAKMPMPKEYFNENDNKKLTTLKWNTRRYNKS